MPPEPLASLEVARPSVLRAQLARTNGARGFHGSVRRTTPHGLSVGIEGRTDLAIGETLVVDLLGAPAQSPLRTAGRVMEVSFAEHNAVIRLALEHPTATEQTEYVALVERRGGIRHPVPATFLCRTSLHLDAHDSPVEVRLYDVSGNSMGLTVDATHEPLLAKSQSAEVRVALPGERDPLSIPCVIRRRSVRGRAIDVGLQLAASDPAALASGSATLSRLIQVVRG